MSNNNIGWADLSYRRLNMMLLPTPQSSDWQSKQTSESWKRAGGVNWSLGNPEFWAAVTRIVEYFIKQSMVNQNERQQY